MSDTKERKPIGKVRGRGQVYDGEQKIADVNYSLTKYQTIHTSHMADGSAPQTEGLMSVDGFIETDRADDLAGRFLTLRLQDGQSINFKASRLSGGLAFMTAAGDFYGMGEKEKS